MTASPSSTARWFRRGAIALGCIAAGVAYIVVDSWQATGARAEGERLERMKKSSRWKAGKFVDTLPRQEGSYWTMTRRWLEGGEHTRPEAAYDVLFRKREDFASPPETGLRITWFGHSSSLVEIDGARILLDPVWSDRCSPLTHFGPDRFHAPPMPLGALPDLTAVVISHDHYDHLDYDTTVALSERGARFVVPLGVGAHLEYWGVPVDRITELDWWGETLVGGIRLVATPARHFSGRSLTMSDKDATLWSGWVIQGPAHRVYYSGDTAMFPSFAEIGERFGPFDAALIEVGAYNPLWADVHLGPEQALEAHRMVRGGVLMPVHWGTFDLALHAWTEPMERIWAAAARAGVRFVTPRPGERFEPSKAPPAHRWWPSVPWQRAEDAPVVSSGLK